MHLIAYLLTTSRLPADHSSACSIFAVTSMIAHKLLQHTARDTAVSTTAQRTATAMLSLCVGPVAGWLMCACDIRMLRIACASHITAVESDLSRELQNGRLFRLLTQLNWITERPQSVTLPRTQCYSAIPTLLRRNHTFDLLPSFADVVCAFFSLLGDRQWCFDRRPLPAVPLS